MKFPHCTGALTLSRVEDVLESFTNAISANAMGACAPDIHRQLIESSEFFWEVRESRADYGVPNRRVFLWRDFLSDLSSDGDHLGML
jgi:hypothetical protein